MEGWFFRHPNMAMLVAYLVGIELAVFIAWLHDITYALVLFDLFCVGAATWVMHAKGWSRWWALLQLVPLLQLLVFFFPNRNA